MLKSIYSVLSARALRLLLAIALLLAGLSQRAGAFDAAQKMTTLAFQFGTDSFAATNRFGSAFTSGAQSEINDGLTSDIDDGTVCILIEMPGLTDLMGFNQSPLNIAIVSSEPVSAPGYNPGSDLDWWYNPNQSDLGSNGVPTNQIAAFIAAKVLNANGGRFSLTPSLLNPATNGGRLDLSSVVLQATVGSATTTLLESANGLPPGHLAAENLPAGAQAFATMASGKLRGNISAASLAATPIPAALVGNGSGYTATNTWLDVLIGGYLEDGVLTLINATQPDQSDPAAPVVGAGAPYKFFATNKSVTSAEDKNGTTVSLSDALNAAAYSSYFTFTTGRVIAPPPAVLSIANATNGIVVSWPSVLTGWTLQSSDSLTSSNWTNCPSVSGNSATINPPSTGNLFFRLNY